MATYIYIKKSNDSKTNVLEQVQLVNDYQVDRVCIEEACSTTKLEKLLKQLSTKDTLVIFSLSLIDLSNEEMCGFFQVLKKKSIHFVSVMDLIDTDKVEYTNFINNCLVYLTANVSEKRKVGRKNKKSPKEIGRPAISTETIKRIIFLREKEKQSIRTIADACGVSIGTVHKYVSHN